MTSTLEVEAHLLLLEVEALMLADDGLVVDVGRLVLARIHAEDVAHAQHLRVVAHVLVRLQVAGFAAPRRQSRQS